MEQVPLIFALCEEKNDSHEQWKLELLDKIHIMKRKHKNHKITATYTDDYNIAQLFRIICERITNEKPYLLSEYKLAYNTIECKLTKKKNAITHQKLMSDQRELLDKIEYIMSGRKLTEFIEETKELVDEYKISGYEKGRVLTIEEAMEDPPINVVDRKIYLIEEFVSICKRYIDIDIVRKVKFRDDICSECDMSLKDAQASENGTIVCPNKECQTEFTVFSNSKCKGEGLASSVPKKSSSDDSLENFMKTFYYKQGLRVKIPDADMEEIFEELDGHFEKDGLPSADEVRMQPLTSRGTRGNTRLSMMWRALSDIKKTRYNKFAPYICKLYWGWELPDYSSIESLVRSDFIKTEKIYQAMPIDERERSSSLALEFRSFKHLELRGVDVRQSDFKIAENERSMRIHNDNWRKMCAGADLPYIDSSMSPEEKRELLISRGMIPG